MIKREIPKFHSEAEEAEWWYEHRDETAEWMEEAAKGGKLTTLTELIERRKRETGLPYTKLLEALHKENRARGEQRRVS